MKTLNELTDAEALKLLIEQDGDLVPLVIKRPPHPHDGLLVCSSYDENNELIQTTYQSNQVRS